MLNTLYKKVLWTYGIAGCNFVQSANLREGISAYFKY